VIAPLLAQPPRTRRAVAAGLAATLAGAACAAGAGTAGAQSPPALEISAQAAIGPTVTPLGPTVRVEVTLRGNAGATAVSIARVDPARACPARPPVDTDDLIADAAPSGFPRIVDGTEVRLLGGPVRPGPARLCIWATRHPDGRAVQAATQVDITAPARAIGLRTRTLFGVRTAMPQGWAASFTRGGTGEIYQFAYRPNQAIGMGVYRSLCECESPRDPRDLFVDEASPRLYGGRPWAARLDTPIERRVAGQSLTTSTIAVLHRGRGRGHTSITVTYPPPMRATAERLLRQALAFRTVRRP
jgi:hypothetical protein